MNKKGKTDTAIILLVIAALVVGYFYFFAGSTNPLSPGKGKIKNGYYDPQTGVCAPEPGVLPGTPFSSNSDISFYQCCFNANGQQIDCNDPSKLLGSFAIYQGQAGIFSVQHSIKLKNTGNVELTNAWIDSYSWDPSSSVLSSAYSYDSGTGLGIPEGSSYGVPLCLTESCGEVFWTTRNIDLQALCGEPGVPQTFDLVVISKASATGLPDVEKTTPAQITCEKEGIGFSVTIDLGA